MKTQSDCWLGEPSLPAETANKDIRRKMPGALPLLRLLIGETLALFIAGVAAPSFLRSGIAANRALAVGSLHTFAVRGVTFTYKFTDLGFAVLGALCGAAIALALDSSGAMPGTERVVRACRRIYWKCFFPAKPGDNAQPATGSRRDSLLRAVPGYLAGPRMGLRRRETI